MVLGKLLPSFIFVLKLTSLFIQYFSRLVDTEAAALVNVLVFVFK
jgi:hypothetical protein